MVTISNPPYNMRWNIPDLAGMDERFIGFGVPPKSNANFAFILSALKESDRCIFILPNGVLTTSNKQELEIKKNIIECNWIESVIFCPDKMFEGTSIPTCVIVFDKNKKTSNIEMIDLRQKYTEEIRFQNGQFGSASHTGRTYEKAIKVISDETIEEVLKVINNQKNIAGFCKSVSIEEIKKNEYNLAPARYIEFENIETLRREYKDIVQDLNRVIDEKNKCKLTINETVAKAIGFDLSLYNQTVYDKEFQQLIEGLAGQKIKKDDYFRATKNKNEVKFENNSKEDISSILMMIFQMWKQHVYFLNIEENRYLAELGQALREDMMSGKINLERKL